MVDSQVPVEPEQRPMDKVLSAAGNMADGPVPVNNKLTPMDKVLSTTGDMADSPVPAEQEPRQIDEVLSTASVFGVIQVLVHLSVFYLLLFVTCLIGLGFFTGHSPPWKCVKQARSEFCHAHQNTTFSIDMDMFNERCSLNRSDWIYVTDINHSFVTEFDLVCSRTSTAAFIAVMYYIGGLFGAFLSGPIGDSWGRKFTLVVLAALAAGGCIGMKYGNAIWHLYLLQFICGFGSAGSVLTSFVILSEFSPPEYRSAASNIGVLCTCMSFMVMDMLAYFLQNWRLLSLYLGILLVPFLAIFLFLPESPRWLLSKGKWNEAERVLSEITTFKGKIRVRVQRTYTTKSKKLYTYLDMVRNCRVFAFTMQVASLWFALPVLYYTISAQTLNYSGDMYLNYFLASVVDFPAFFLATWSNNTIGRKKTTLSGCLVSGVFIGVVPAIPRSFCYHYAFTMFFTVLAHFCVSVSWYGLFLWTPELFPTVLRAQGMAICIASERIAMMTVPLLCIYLQVYSYCIPFIVMGVLGLLGFLAALPLPETNKKPTRETFEDFFPKSDVATSNDVGLDNIGLDHA